jgi:hypothetical protein
MSVTFNTASVPWLQKLQRYRAWLLVGLAILVVLIVRVRLRDMPLERDEGEYAYAGQLMLHGVPPYREAYTMKLPGTYAAYALIMAVFGQSPAGIHLGLAFVNVASIILVFRLGRRLLDNAAAAAAAVAFALLSLSPYVLGLAAHATHFVVLCALGGMVLLLRACEGEAGDPRSEVRGQRSEVGSDQTTGPRTTDDKLPTTDHAPHPTHPTRESQIVNREFLTVFGSGLLFGLAVLMKQHGLFLGLCATLYLLRVRVGEWLAAASLRSQQRDVRSPRERKGFDFASPPARAGRARLLRDLVLFALGGLLPYGLTCVVLWFAGAFQPFIFWTISYARQYASAAPLVLGPALLRAALREVIGPNLLFWVLPWVGALVMWWEPRLNNTPPRQAPIADRQLQIAYPRFFLLTWLFCSFASASVGLYFREHYFILVLPALALFTGVAVSRGLHLLKHDTTIELFLALPILGLFGLGVCAALIGHGAVWFTLPLDQSMRSIFGTTLFSETAHAADYLKAHTPPDARIAVLGSEPEIYFYSHRRAATGHIYMYPLMDESPYALKLQEEMIAEILRARPTYILYVDDRYSWLQRPRTPQRIFQWWNQYWASEMDLIMTIGFQEDLQRGTDMDEPAKETPAPSNILVFKRRQG